MVEHTKNVEAFRQDLLSWYDVHRRVLPWRALPGRTADPYHVWLSEIMLQQTTVQAVIPYFLKFLEKWPSVHDLAVAPAHDVMQAWAGLGYYARARNLHKCAKFISETLGGMFPSEMVALKSLPGVGDYTSAAISAIAFNQTANVVDGNVERVMARVHAVMEPLPFSKPALKKLAGEIAKNEVERPGDYAQALMDLGATVCTPSSPKCMICPVRPHCSAQALGIALTLPVRTAKAVRPRKHGYVYWITDQKRRVLFEKRAESGLLGGMIGLPTSPWIDVTEERNHLEGFGNSVDTNVRVRHVFTHFELDLAGSAMTLENHRFPDNRYFWMERSEAHEISLPTLFKKAFSLFTE